LGFSVQLPADTVPVQLAPVVSATVTVSLPGIVPLPGAFTATVKLAETDCPSATGFGVLPVILVVAAMFTVWATPEEVLMPKCRSR
jgi:hypothetical protein